MTDLTATLDAIDTLAVHECGHCRRPLRPDGPSEDFCGPWCQEAWLTAKHEVQELVGYREPYDLPQHVGNLEEMYSPEVTPEPTWDTEIIRRFNAVSEFRITVDVSHFITAMERASEAFRGLSASWVIYDEIRPFGVLINSRPTAEPEPEPGEPPFGSDFDFERTPAKSLPHQPPPAVMPVLPEVDWQAVVDGAPRTGPGRRRRAWEVRP